MKRARPLPNATVIRPALHNCNLFHFTHSAGGKSQNSCNKSSDFADRGALAPERAELCFEYKTQAPKKHGHPAAAIALSHTGSDRRSVGSQSKPSSGRQKQGEPTAFAPPVSPLRRPLGFFFTLLGTHRLGKILVRRAEPFVHRLPGGRLGCRAVRSEERAVGVVHDGFVHGALFGEDS